MTTDVADGRIVSVATCACKQVFKFGSNDYLRMNAAIEAHWRRFSHEKTVDGRGQPIGSEGVDARVKPGHDGKPKNARPKRSQRRSEPGDEAIPQGDGHDGDVRRQALRDIAAGKEVDWSIVRGDDDDDLAIEWPSYDAFLEDKIVTAPKTRCAASRSRAIALHPWLKPHCKDLTVWALRLGCAAIFANFGLHKTAMQLEWCRQLHKHRQPTLNVVPLGVRHGFIKEALQLGMDVRFIRTNAESTISNAKACALPDELREHPRGQARSEPVRRLLAR
jgi:hypothetical protein